MKEFYAQFECERDRKYSIIIEDNGNVAYAYLLYDGNITSDVWLYNHGMNPESVDWCNDDNMPFLNPKKYLKNDLIISPIKLVDDITLSWKFKINSFSKVIIYIRGEAIAILNDANTPGQSFLVNKDGPLAKVINVDPKVSPGKI